ncbi:hypothetical protein B4U80_13634 [Leptotrombidium deliense]|uniref:Uncharacterized protein n=1 Tax=Leptotrombidium deliense TaxID=299467 RepID=A0A443SRI1_9ACAR|nr:hypothetical protein B4U80_13634 [Leptotrombidium deliense]
MANHMYDVNVHSVNDPITDPWFGGQNLATHMPDLFSQLCITKKDYEQNGIQYSFDKFDV